MGNIRGSVMMPQGQQRIGQSMIGPSAGSGRSTSPLTTSTNQLQGNTSPRPQPGGILGMFNRVDQRKADVAKMRATEGFEHLPEHFKALDANFWKDKASQELYCEICQCTFNKLSATQKRHHCRRCGLAICH